MKPNQPYPTPNVGQGEKYKGNVTSPNPTKEHYDA